MHGEPETLGVQQGGDPIKVLFVHGGGDIAGAERVLLSLLRNIDGLRVKATLAILADGPFVDEAATLNGIEVLSFPPVPRIRHVAAAQRTTTRVRDLIRETGAQVVQSTGEKMIVLSARAARRAHRPLVAWLHDAPAERGEWSTAAVQTLMAVSPKARVVTCSTWMASAFHSRYRLDCDAIPNGVEHDRLPSPAAGRELVLAETNWPDDTVVIGHIGRLQRWKGVHVFLEAAAIVRQRLPHAPLGFLLVGDALFGREPQYRSDLEELARRLDLGGTVHFTGHRDDALELMAGCDIVVHCATKREPFGMVVLEAMALGRAVIASAAGGPLELLTHRRDGMLVQPDDATALAAAVEEIAADQDRRRALGAAARETSLSFTARQMAARFEQLWSDLASPRNADDSASHRLTRRRT